MNRIPPAFRSRAFLRAALVSGLALVSAAASVPAFAAQDSDLRRHPGFVDGSEFGKLAGEDSELVEVNLGPSLLRAIARGADDDPEAKSVLSGLLGVNAYIVGLDHDAAREDRAAKMIKEVAQRLEASGWERLVRVREKSESVNVFVRNGERTLDGLVVLSFDRDDSQVVFANLVGSIDLARLGDLRGTLDVPGLDAVEEPAKKGTSDKSPPAPDAKKKGAGRDEAPRPAEAPRAEANEEAL